MDGLVSTDGPPLPGHPWLAPNSREECSLDGLSFVVDYRGSVIEAELEGDRPLSMPCPHEERCATWVRPRSQHLSRCGAANTHGHGRIWFKRQECSITRPSGLCRQRISTSTLLRGLTSARPTLPLTPRRTPACPIPLPGPTSSPSHGTCLYSMQNFMPPAARSSMPHPFLLRQKSLA